MKTKTLLVAAMFFLLAGTLPAAAFASPRGHGGRAFSGGERGDFHEGFHGGGHREFRSGRIIVGPAYGFGWGLGWGWGDPWFWSPYYYPNTGMLEVRRANYGTLEFKVKPENTKVYVDKKFIGEVSQLDHHRAYVAAGNHEIMLKAPDGQTMERNIYVAAGKKIKIDERL
jgi:hypothetical protein